jgi:phospholipid/cholesterol/gamma-HCH transport system substrate-binding protein
MEVFRSEIKVGLLIVVSFVLLSIGIFITSDLRNLWEDKRSIVLLFPYADGLTKGSPVWYAGLEVGEVSDVRIATQARDRIGVTVKIDPKAQVRKDSRVDIRSLGMMGAKYVEISPGSPDSPELAPGEIIEGGSPTSLTQVMETGYVVAARLVDLIQETRTLIKDLGSESAIKATVQNANALLVELRERGQELKPVMGNLTSFSSSLDAAGKHLNATLGEGGKDLTALLKELRDTNKGLKDRINDLQARIDKTLTQVDKGFSDAGSCVRDVRSLVVSSEQDIASLLRHLSETSRHLEALSEDLRAHPYKVIWKKDGTVDELVPSGTDQWREKGRIGPHGRE